MERCVLKKLHRSGWMSFRLPDISWMERERERERERGAKKWMRKRAGQVVGQLMASLVRSSLLQSFEHDVVCKQSLWSFSKRQL